MKEEVDVPKVIISVLFCITLIIILSYLFFGPIDYTKEYLERIFKGEIKNPLLESNGTALEDKNLSVNDTISFFFSLHGRIANESGENLSNLIKESITYSLIYIKAYNLHNPPLSSDTSKIQFLVDDKTYNSEIIKGEIYTSDGKVANPDITIQTSKEEILKMISSKEYIQESINSGKSEIIQNADQITLFLKGYTDLDLILK